MARCHFHCPMPLASSLHQFASSDLWQAHLSPDDFRAKYPKAARDWLMLRWYSISHGPKAKFPVPGHYPTKPKSQVASESLWNWTYFDNFMETLGSQSPSWKSEASMPKFWDVFRSSCIHSIDVRWCSCVSIISQRFMMGTARTHLPSIQFRMQCQFQAMTIPVPVIVSRSDAVTVVVHLTSQQHK